MTRRRNSREPRIPDLIAALVDPRLRGAACTGLPHLFDDWLDDGETREARSYRHAVAVRICTRCPVQAACNTAANEHDAHGIWSGHLRNDAGTPGRPRKAS